MLSNRKVLWLLIFVEINENKITFKRGSEAERVIFITDTEEISVLKIFGGTLASEGYYCYQLLQQHENDTFWDLIVTDDKKFVLYNNSFSK